MLVVRNRPGESGHHTAVRRKRQSGAGVWLALGLLPLITGCTATQLGPNRPITIEEDVANIRILAEPDLTVVGPLNVAARNQIVTARMYIADLEYHKYEAKLTRDLQEEGLGATLAILGLTSAATLVDAASTKSILSATATAVTGADKAFSDKVLLSNTIQALQVQMRADRQTQAAVIFAKMATPIDEYTLPMALSDVDKYYQAGTLASALVGLNKTVANAEQHAMTAHDLAGPNGELVTSLKTVANPPPTTTRTALSTPVIANPIVRVGPPVAPLRGAGQFANRTRPVVADTTITDPDPAAPLERGLQSTKARNIQIALCQTPAPADALRVAIGAETRAAIRNFKSVCFGTPLESTTGTIATGGVSRAMDRLIAATKAGTLPKCSPTVGPKEIGAALKVANGGGC
jgi:hypothetical protein